MLELTTEQRDALALRKVMRRHFIWCEARHPDTGAPDPAGFWNDVGNVTHEGRLYHGSGNLITVSALAAKGNLSIPGLTITLSGIRDDAIALVRGKAIAQAPIELLLGIFDVDTHAVIPPLIPRFVGFVDDCNIQTPETGGDSVIELICESASRALTKRSTATRSHASAQARDPTDDFYKYTAAQRDKPLYFGRRPPTGAAA